MGYIISYIIWVISIFVLTYLLSKAIDKDK